MEFARTLVWQVWGHRDRIQLNINTDAVICLQRISKIKSTCWRLGGWNPIQCITDQKTDGKFCPLCIKGRWQVAPVEWMPWPYTLVRGHGEDTHELLAYTHGGVLHKRSIRPKVLSPCLCRSLSTGSFYTLNAVDFSTNLSKHFRILKQPKTRVLKKGKGGAISSFFHLRLYAPCIIA